MIKYGFELEGFAIPKDKNTPCVPPRAWPTDGFPGLVEIRTRDGDELGKQYGALLEAITKLDHPDYDYNFDLSSWKFSAEDMALMRKTRRFVKNQVDVKNIYGKSQRRLGNITLASFQINISNQIHPATDKKGEYIPAQYGLLDIAGIVKRLDKEFADNIAETKRQPGMFAIKDNHRLEYRSLPNNVFEAYEATTLLSKIKSAVEPKEF